MVRVTRRSREFVTAQDVDRAFRRGDTSLTVTPETVVTAEGRDRAARLEMELVEAGAAPTKPDGGLPERVSVVPRSDAVITNGRVVLPGDGIFPLDIVIEDGKVAVLGSGLASDGLEIDAAGMSVLPGLFDPHVHLGLFAPMEKEVVTEGKAALFGGITTLGWFIDGPGSHLQRLRDIRSLVDRDSPVDIVPHLVLSDNQQLAELATYVELGVRSFKLYMCGLPGLIDPVDDAFLVDVFESLARFGDECVVCIHAENASLVNRELRHLEQVPNEDLDLERWAKVHPTMAEEEAIQRAALLSREFGVRVYFVHVSSPNGLNALARVRAGEGHWRILAETSSPYLAPAPTGDKEQLGKMVPPLRDQETVDALWRALASGAIDTVGTDNVTMTRAEKGVGGPMRDVKPGYPALGTHLALLLEEGYHVRGIGLHDLVEAVTRRPAEVFGLYPRKGTLLPGSDADITCVNLDDAREVSASRLGSRSDFSVVEGRTLRGWPVLTMKGGSVAFLQGQYRRLSGGRLILR